MSGPSTNIFTIDPEAAVQLAAGAMAFEDSARKLKSLSRELKTVEGCGDFPSGLKIKASLQSLGQLADAMAASMESELGRFVGMIKTAGDLIVGKEDDTVSHLQKAPEGSALAPFNPNDPMAGVKEMQHSDQPASRPRLHAPSPGTISFGGLTPRPPTVDPKAAGKFAVGANPESIMGMTVDVATQHLANADRGFAEFGGSVESRGGIFTRR